jgi:hypothetical protein
MVIYVPAGSSDDATNLPEDFDATAQFLMQCGVLPLEETVTEPPTNLSRAASLFA